MEIGKIYFWTATINNWQMLLLESEFKEVIIDSLKYLSAKNKIDVFAFVIMPNHVHFIWRMNEMNGKEMPSSSFLKFTAHEFKKKLLHKNADSLKNYEVDLNAKSYEFWKIDSLAIELYSSNVAYQKLEYLHYNPCAKKWNLAEDFTKYKYSTVRFYELGILDYDFIKDLRNEF